LAEIANHHYEFDQVQKVIAGLVDRLTLFTPHRKSQVMRARELLPSPQFCEDSL